MSIILKISIILLIVPLIINQCSNLNKDLMGYWPLNGNANDESGFNNHGIVIGAQITENRFGNKLSAYLFNGIEDYIKIGDSVPSPLSSIQNEISYSAWIYHERPSSDGGLYTIVGCQNDQGPATGTSIHLDYRPNTDWMTNEAGHLHFQIGNYNWHHSNSKKAIPYGKWVLIVATRKANENPNIYVDNVMQELETLPWSGSIKYDGAGYYIGKQQTLGRFFKGKIDDIRVYNRTLSSIEVQCLYNEPNPFPSSPAISIGYQENIRETLYSSYVIFNLTWNLVNQSQENISPKITVFCLETSTNISLLNYTLNSSLYITVTLSNLLDLYCPFLNSSDLIYYHNMFSVEFLRNGQVITRKYWEFIYSVEKTTNGSFQLFYPETINSSTKIKLKSKLDSCLNSYPWCVNNDGTLIIIKDVPIYFSQTLENQQFFLEFEDSMLSCNMPKQFQKSLLPVFNNNSTKGKAIYGFKFTDICTEGKFEIISRLIPASNLRMLSEGQEVSNKLVSSSWNINIKGDATIGEDGKNAGLNDTNRGLMIGIIIVVIVLVLIILAIILYCVCKKYRSRKNINKGNDPKKDLEKNPNDEQKIIAKENEKIDDKNTIEIKI